MSGDALLVTGASGFVGSSILASWPGAMPRVALVRSGARDAQTGPSHGVTFRTLESWTEEGLARVLDGVGAVIHCASVVHRPDATEAEYRRFNLEGTRALVRACRARGVRRLVFMSTVKVYGEEPAASTLDESSPVVGDTFYARTKIEAERVVLDAAAAGGPSGAVLRLCPVYGRGDKGNVRAMVRAIARRRFVLPGRGANRKSIVHVSTVSEVARAAVDSTAGGVFVVADTEAPTMRHLADTMAGVLSLRPPRSVPEPVMQVAAGAVEGIARALGRTPPVTREQLRKLLQPTVCSPARARAELGASCHVDLVEAITDEVRWLRDASLL